MPIRQDNELGTGDFGLVQTAVGMADANTCTFDPQRFGGHDRLLLVPDRQDPEGLATNNGLWRGDRPRHRND